MSQRQLDYASPRARQSEDDGPIVNWRSGILALIICAVVAGVNYLLVAEAVDDRSWGALHIMIVVGPLTNGAMCLASFACTPLVRRYTGTITLHFLASLLPIGAIVFDGLAILSMDLRGC